MRLIDADALINRIVFHSDLPGDQKEVFEDEINAEPSIEPKQREKGKWIEEDDGWDGVFWRCSECNEPFYLVDGTPVDNEYHYCPNCGADMRGDQNEND